MKTNHMKHKIIIISIFVIILLGTGYFYYYANYQGSSSKQTFEIEVKQGESASTILSTLKSKGIVKNTLMSKIYLKFHNPSVKANSYTFNASMSIQDIFDEMSKKNSQYISGAKFQIIEGETIPKVALKVAKLLNISDDEVIKQWNDTSYIQKLSQDYWFINAKTLMQKDILYRLEGYFYPETYHIQKSSLTLDKITRMMLDQMNKHLEKYKDTMTNLQMTPHQFLTLSSIVQKETLYDKDISQIAGVFINRLHQNMRLESDITVNYALQRTGVNVSYAMLQTNSPYNTYKVKGLPIGPVGCSVDKIFNGIANYTKHHYLYFFAKKDGSVVYSHTYAEHEAAIKKYKWY